MYFDPKLWIFTRGVRGRIAWTVVIGVVAAAVGIALPVEGQHPLVEPARVAGQPREHSGRQVALGP